MSFRQDTCCHRPSVKVSNSARWKKVMNKLKPPWKKNHWTTCFFAPSSQRPLCYGIWTLSRTASWRVDMSWCWLGNEDDLANMIQGGAMNSFPLVCAHACLQHTAEIPAKQWENINGPANRTGCWQWGGTSSGILRGNQSSAKVMNKDLFLIDPSKLQWESFMTCLQFDASYLTCSIAGPTRKQRLPLQKSSHDRRFSPFKRQHREWGMSGDESQMFITFQSYVMQLFITQTFLILTSSSKAQAALLAATSICIPRGIASCWLHWLIEVPSPRNQKIAWSPRPSQIGIAKLQPSASAKAPDW